MVVIELPWPPSVNAYWRSVVIGRQPRVLISEEGRNYRKAVAQSFMVQRIGSVGTARCAVDIEVRKPDNRRRDVDNLPKAILDSLTHAGLWVDDSQIDDLRIWRSDRKGGVVIVRVRELSLPQGCLVTEDAYAF